MGSSGSKEESPAQAAQTASSLQQKINDKGGQPLNLQPGQSFELNPNRGVTDCFILVIWILFWVMMFIIAGFGISRGNPARLHFGYDFNGKVCGTGSIADRPFVFYPFPYPSDLTSGSLDGADFTWATCVKKCPDQRLPMVPNSCMQMFKVPTKPGDQSGPLAMKAVVTCGSKEDGTPSDDGSTDMSTFGIRGFVGFAKYCLKYRPLCQCKAGSSNSSSSSCCEPNANEGSVGAQIIVDGVPQVEEMADTSARKQFGIVMGYQYGFCYLPYPSYAPGSNNGSSGMGSWTRCIPRLSSGSSNYSVSLSAIDSAQGNNSTSSQKEKEGAMDKAMGAVMKSMSGPGETVKTLVEQVRKYKGVIAGCAGITLVVAIAYTFLLKIAAFPLILTIMVSIWVMLLCSCGILILKAGYIDAKSIPGSDFAATRMPEGVTFGPAETNKQMVVAGVVILAICFVIYSLVLCVMVPRLKLACKVINVAAVCLASMPTTLLFPIIQFICSAALSIYFCIVLWYLASAGSWNETEHRYIVDEDLQGLIIIHAFGFLWGQNFILAVGNLAIAGAAADWFLVDDKKSLSLPAFSSLGRTFRYHMGTAAFGSFIIAVVQMIRWAFRYYIYQLKKLDKDGTFKHLVAILSCIGECCLSCLERFLDFINKNAYIQTSITGASFCPAARAGSLLLVRNMLRVGTLQIISSAFIFVGKYFIALAVALIGAIWMVALDSGGSISDGWANVSAAPVFPVAIVALLAFNIACAFLDVWDMVIDTIFQCYCMDEEYGTGKAPGEMKTAIAENPPSAEDLRAMEAVTAGSGSAGMGRGSARS